LSILPFLGCSFQRENEKGKPFQPDERQTKILTEGAFVGESMTKALAFDARAPNALYRPDANWQYFLLLDPAPRASP
jgi:hypothetical protein